MDIEGGEFSVLPTMLPYLRKHRPTLHLSLHPFFLPESCKGGVVAKTMRLLTRYVRTFRILWHLRFYTYLYTERGKERGVYSMAIPAIKGPATVIATDFNWSSSQ